MYCLIYRVAGTNGIIDTEDGVIERLSDATVRDLVSKGVRITGVSVGGLNPVCCTLGNYKLCNWCNGRNVFDIGRAFVVNKKGEFKFRAGDKTYKGVVCINETYASFKFSFNVIVNVPIQIFNDFAKRI